MAYIRHGMPVISEEESVMKMTGKYLVRLICPRRKTTSIRQHSVVNSSQTDNNSPFLNLDAGLNYEEEQHMTQQIESCLTEAKSSTLYCQVLLLPQDMTTRVGQGVVLSSAEEPCGLRGASIKVYLEGKDGLKLVGSISPDPSVNPTFELFVIFAADKNGGWPSLKHIFNPNKVLKLKSGYRLVKRKLYSPASPVILDFN